MTPPTMKTDCQPQAGINRAEMSPPRTAPTVNQQDTSIMIVTRLRLGLNSPASAMAFGMLLVFGVGLAHADKLHNAAHDTRHSIGFPCH